MKLARPAIAAALAVFGGICAGLLLDPGRAAAAGGVADMLASENETGQAETFLPRGTLKPDNAFFQSLGANGRSCVTCHEPGEGWTITPAGVQSRFEASDGLDPIFRTNDGSTCAGADISTLAARRSAFSLLLSRGLIRVQLDVPAGAEFAIDSVYDPYNCGNNLTSASLYRRPLPSTNLRFLSAIMWDGRESTPALTMREGLLAQARNATLGHAEAAASPTDADLEEIVRFELGLHTAQALDMDAGNLATHGASGGPKPLSRQPFFIGMNDPLGQNPTGATFEPNAFTLFDKWQSLHNAPGVPFDGGRAAIARGQQLFNTRSIEIVGVSGLNDELRAASVPGTCTTCHDTPNVGNHSVSVPLNVGLTDPDRRTADMPHYTLRNRLTGETNQTTDPGRAMITGKWKDIGRFKGPILRGLAARPPYFHNGFAATLLEVVEFYDTRFDMRLTAEEKSDLVAFLRAL
jgi:hypothetical protein